MEPTVHDTHLDQPVHPGILKQVVNVGFAYACAYTCHHFVIQAVLETLHGFAEDIVAAPTLIADDLCPLDTDQRSDVAELPEAFCHLVCNKMSVGENLEVCVWMGRQDIEQLFVHEWLATQDAKECISHLLGFGQRFVHGSKVDFGLLPSHVDPTSLASKVAGVDDGDVQKRREKFPAFQPSFMLLYASKSAKTREIRKLPKEAFVGFEQQSLGEPKIHAHTFLGGGMEPVREMKPINPACVPLESPNSTLVYQEKDSFWSCSG